MNTYSGNGTWGYADGINRESMLAGPSGVAWSTNGDIYIADSNNNRIRKMTSTGANIVQRMIQNALVLFHSGLIVFVSGMVSTVGGGNYGSCTDGIGNETLFSYPTALVVSPAGDVFVADQGNSVIRKITSMG